MAKFDFLSDLDQPWHHLPVEQVLTMLASSMEGLTYVNARQRLRYLGANKLPRSRPIFKIWLQPLLNPFTYVLLVVAIYLQWQGAEGWILLLVGALHGGFGIYLAAATNAIKERVSRDRPQRRQHEPSNSVMVLRDREALELPSRDLVIGDILLLQAGDRPNVDLRLVESSAELIINQTNLGGEAICQKQADLICDLKTSSLDCGNMIWAGTEITSGTAKGVVIARGLLTKEQSALTKEKPFSAIHSELRYLSQVWLGIVILVITTANGLSWRRGITLNLMITAALIISTYPQNLLRLATYVQLLGMRDLAKQGLWARFPAVLDAIGRVTTIVPIVESDVVLSFDELSRGGISWRGLIRASEDDAQAFGQVIGIETHSYFAGAQERIRQWQGDRRRASVAVIGNDLEDISLLRAADVGICDRNCCKELQDSAALILPKEDFHYLPIAILEGRAVVDRLQRMVTLSAVSAFTLAIVVLMDAAAGFSIPPLQLIWIGAIATPIVAIPLVIEPTHQHLLHQPAHRFQTMLRPSNYMRISLAVFATVTAVSLVFGLKYQGQAALLSQARTMAFVTLGFSQIFHACAIARQSIFQNLPLLLGVSAIALLQVLFVQVAWFSDILLTVPLNGVEWAIAILSATAVFWVQELLK